MSPSPGPATDAGVRAAPSPEPLLVPGTVTGFRLFELDGDRLRPPFRGGEWTHPVTTAWCGRRRHRAPVADCSCGLHAWYAADDALANLGRGQVVAVVAASGDLVLAQEGFRAERMQVVAVCLPSRRTATEARRERVRRVALAHWPGVEVVDGPRALRRDWPADDLSALGVTPRRTGMSVHAPRAAVGWLVGVLAIWALALVGEGAGAALRDGWWLALVAGLAAWKAWLLVTALRAVR